MLAPLRVLTNRGLIAGHDGRGPCSPAEIFVLLARTARLVDEAHAACHDSACTAGWRVSQRPHTDPPVVEPCMWLPYYAIDVGVVTDFEWRAQGHDRLG